MSYPSTFVTIQNAVLAKGRLDSASDTNRIKDWINQAYYRTAVEVEYYQSSSAATALTAGATSATVPTAIVGIEYIVPTGSDGSAWGPMEEVSFQELLGLRAWSGGTVPTGAPSRYAFREGSSSNTIEFWPQAAGGEVLTFYGYCLPTALSADGDLPIFPEPYASKCLEYGALLEGAEFLKDPYMLQQYQGEYQDWLARFRAFRNNRRGARVQSLAIERQRPYPRGNSVDTGIY